jgi:hypothetical protein
MAEKCDKCETCLDRNTDYWQRPCFVCTFGDRYVKSSLETKNLKDRWK